MVLPAPWLWSCYYLIHSNPFERNVAIIATRCNCIAIITSRPYQVDRHRFNNHGSRLSNRVDLLTNELAKILRNYGWTWRWHSKTRRVFCLKVPLTRISAAYIMRVSRRRWLRQRRTPPRRWCFGQRTFLRLIKMSPKRIFQHVPFSADIFYPGALTRACVCAFWWRESCDTYTLWTENGEGMI